MADASLSLEEQLSSGKIPIIVPEGFEDQAVSENLYVGPAMGRRASYQYGVYLDKSVSGSLAMGIGMGQSTGNSSYISPTYEITATGESYVIDGVEMEFQLTPGTEAPAEMNTWLPEKRHFGLPKTAREPCIIFIPSVELKCATELPGQSIFVRR